MVLNKFPHGPCFPAPRCLSAFRLQTAKLQISPKAAFPSKRQIVNLCEFYGVYIVANEQSDIRVLIHRVQHLFISVCLHYPSYFAYRSDGKDARCEIVQWWKCEYERVSKRYSGRSVALHIKPR